MSDGWFVALAALGLITFLAVAVASWVVRSVANQGDRETLSAADLQLLKESVETLIVQLKEATDEAVSEIETRQRALQTLLDRADGRAPLGLDEPAAEDGRGHAVVEELDLRDIYRLGAAGVGRDEIARRAGLTRAGVDAMLGLTAAAR